MKPKRLSLKNGLPFRLGCTSYVIPDDILPNVEKMAPLVDDIEIVLFESSELCNFPDKTVIKELARLSKIYGNTYTIHLPTDKKAGALDEKERMAFVEQVAEVVDLTKPLVPHAYILHLEGITSKEDEQQHGDWHHRVHEFCGSMVKSIPIYLLSSIVVETLEFPWQWMVPFVNEFGFRYCFDIGHAWLYKHDWQAMCGAILPQTRVVHLHGLDHERDHKSLRGFNGATVRDFLSELRLNRYEQVVTLEVFSETDTFESIETVKRLWAQLHC